MPSIDERLDRLQAGFDAVLVSLRDMTDVLGVQSEMLTRLLEAAGAEPDNTLGETLAEIAAGLARQAEALEAIGQRLDTLPEDIAAAVA